DQPMIKAPPSDADLDSLKAEFSKINTHAGAFIKSDPLADYRLGTSLRTLVILAKHEKEPIRFLFQFYKPRDHWQMTGLDFDNDLFEAIKQTARAVHLKSEAASGFESDY
ncbi:hypothetical protein, partial [Thiocapsa sp. UBA6158]|uniref:hypothetical protein n=1 Tax=Thiocapsa sp. UBA6158 TaxID=1947692 RepID=UPI0026008B58